ncbi:MAG: S8 family serine peptidase [Synergistaceae bacterium]|nr:S8 family serine peptidase [Synergistaceae bacterium]
MSHTQALDKINTVSAGVARSANAVLAATYDAVSINSDKVVMMISSKEKTTEELIKELKKDSNVLSAVPNYIHYISTAKNVKNGKASGQNIPATASPNDPMYNEMWGLRAINAPSAWDKTTGKEDVYVVVLETGLDHEHEDLAGNLGTFNGNYAGCWVLQIYDFYEKDMETGKEKLIRTEIMKISGQFDPDKMNLDSWGDLDSHGTHVAGTIGAVGNNSLGVTGVNWKVRLLGIGTTKVILDEDDKVVEIEPGELSDGQIIKGLNIILQQKKTGLNIRAVNMSFGDWYTPQYQLEESPYYVALKAVSDAGVILVAAAGNDFQNLDAPGGPGSDLNYSEKDYRGKICYPACYKLANLITVGAVSADKSWCDFSNYSPSYVDIAAPGAEIMSTLPRYVLSGGKVISQDLYGKEFGTSMAAPHVTGAVALLCAAYPDKTASEIKELLLNNADKNFAKEGKSAYGMLDLGSAMKAGAPAPTPSGGGSGCNGGIPFVALLSVMAVAFFKKKR